MAQVSTELLLDWAEASAEAKLGRSLRPLQREVLAHLAEGRDVFASLPTGYGKSLCAWAPAAAWGWRVWVLCPLVSLIEDQSLAAQQLGIEAVALHAGVEGGALRDREAQLDRASLVFLSPERLIAWWRSGYLDALRMAGGGPDLLVLDEMHCFEEWREFRPAFQEAFAAVRQILTPGARLLGMSASLAAEASYSWMTEFTESHARVSADLGRERLVLRVIATEEEEERWWLLPSLLRDRRPGDAALIYCATREECDVLARWLNSLGERAVAYHAGLPAGLRAERSRAFREGRLPVVCATAAFGMGIDFPRVRRVIHFSTPYDLESYWQEAGRAGRDGDWAYAIALWRRSDITRAHRMSARQRARYYQLWSAWLAGGCRKRAVAEALGLGADDCGSCDRCLPSTENLPEWLHGAVGFRPRPAWWTDSEADGLRWAKEKIFNAP